MLETRAESVKQLSVRAYDLNSGFLIRERNLLCLLVG